MRAMSSTETIRVCERSARSDAFVPPHLVVLAKTGPRLRRIVPSDDPARDEALGLVRHPDPLLALERRHRRRVCILSAVPRRGCPHTRSRILARSTRRRGVQGGRDAEIIVRAGRCAAAEDAPMRRHGPRVAWPRARHDRRQETRRQRASRRRSAAVERCTDGRRSRQSTRRAAAGSAEQRAQLDGRRVSRRVETRPRRSEPFNARSEVSVGDSSADFVLVNIC